METIKIIDKTLKEIFRVIKDKGQIALTILKKSEVDLDLFKDFRKIDAGKILALNKTLIRK